MTVAETKAIHPAPYSKAILRFLANGNLLPETGTV